MILRRRRLILRYEPSRVRATRDGAEIPSHGRRHGGRPSVSSKASQPCSPRPGLAKGNPMIEARGLTKRYGSTLAVDRLDFDVAPGRVTGFLGPNGAGKTTTMRLVLGLDRPTAGAVTVNGRPYGELRYPLYEVGALLDAKAAHGGRRALAHLWCLAQSNRIPRKRVEEVLALVGLQDVARRRIGNYSLGMSQRLGIAAA